VPLAVEKAPPEELSASEYARNAAMLRQGFGQDVVLVMASALSRLSMLAEDAIATCAMRDRDLGTALEKGELVGCRGADEADVCMESWKYDLGHSRKTASSIVVRSS